MEPQPTQRRRAARRSDIEFELHFSSQPPKRVVASDASIVGAAFAAVHESDLLETRDACFVLDGRHCQCRRPFEFIRRSDTGAPKIIVKYSTFAEELRAFIASPSSGMLLDADVAYREKNPSAPAAGRAAFQLHSGVAVKHFITIWEMFDHREMLTRCVEELAAKARELWHKTYFSKIATCTATARELANYLYDELRASPGTEVSIVHFDDDPIALTGALETHGLQDDRVLILTDIVSTGSLVRSMTEMILRNGGNPVAILAVVITNGAHIRRQTDDNERPRIPHSGRACQVVSITDYCIDALADNEYDADKIIPIDYASVMPLPHRINKAQYQPRFSVPELIAASESCGALDFSFYQLDEKRFTIALALSKLLADQGDAIWKSISAPILKTAQAQPDRTVVLVSSFKQNDLLFKDFVQDRLRAAGFTTSTVVTLKRGVRDSTYLNLTLGERRVDVEGRDVILLLGTLASSEKLRSIVSLILEKSVRKLVVVCLLNRMGLYTTSFISAIERFTRRTIVDETSDRRQDSKTTPTEFEFHMVYSILDVPGDNLAKMRAHIGRDIALYKSRTKVDAFHRLADRMLTYFEPPDHVREPPSRSELIKLKQTYAVRSEPPSAAPIELRTQEGKIAYLTYRLAIDHDYRPLFTELLQARDRKTLFHVLGLLLSDVEHLHSNGTLIDLYKRIQGRLSALREERFALERSRWSILNLADSGPELSERVNLELYLMFALGVIASHGSWDELVKITSIEEMLFCGRDFDQWRQYPNNLWHFFSAERAFFAVSYLLHALDPNFSRASSAKIPKHKIHQRIEYFRERFNAYAADIIKAGAPDETALRAHASLINNNMDVLLADAGIFDRQEKHQVIRFLHRHVLKPKHGHNPIFTNATRLSQDLEGFLGAREQQHDAVTRPFPASVLVSLDDSLNALATLPQIALATKYLFSFTPSPYEDHQRYTNPPNTDGLAHEARELINRLTNLRRKRSASRLDLNRIDTHNRRIYEDLTAEPLLGALRKYVVDLREMIDKSLEEGNKRLREAGRNVVLQKPADQTGRPSNMRLPVLCDPHLLHETLRNVFYNLRHSYPAGGRGDVEMTLTLADRDIYGETGTLRGILFVMRARDASAAAKDRILNPASTIGDQLLRLRDFGVYSDFKDEDASHVLNLWFISRDEFAMNAVERGDGS